MKTVAPSFMQNYPLTVDKFIDHAAVWSANGVVQALPDGRRLQVSYGEVRDRANLMSGALAALGLEFGERVGTLAWNTRHHLEIYYATMGSGLVCHTLNPRLTVAQVAAMVCEAEDAALAVASDLVPLAFELVSLCPLVRHLIVLDDPSGMAAAPTGVPVWDYEDLLADKGSPVAWGAFDENAPAGLCYTSGTTSEPKGVLYTHRSNYLHTLRSLVADAFAITATDVVLLAVPMFHANGWGLPFSVPAAGARMILPGRNLKGEALATLMSEEQVTIAVGVPTVWTGVLDQLEQYDRRLPALNRLLVGGSTCPESLIRRAERSGVRVQASWGMTELSPLGTIMPPTSGDEKSGCSGRPPVGLEIKLTDGAGHALPDQRGHIGHLRVKGIAVIDRYFNNDDDVIDEEGFFDTGDLAMIDEDGDLTICGRSKDLIKSGGEWINPAEMEAIVGAQPSVDAVAVIGRSDGKWGERPVLVVQPHRGCALDRPALIDCLRGKVADWWLPNEVAEIAEMPLAATGKIDKMRLREQFEDGALEVESIAG
jgi:acyl-CoA synthetase (AMP-forming)/AMP-acid ligase II